MQYLDYICLIGAFVVGFMSWHPIFLLLLALMTTFLFMSARRSHVKARPHTENANMIVDGAFLFAVQIMIIFTVYAIGDFLANRVPVGPV